MLQIQLAQRDLLPADLIDEPAELLPVTLVTIHDRSDLTFRECDNCNRRFEARDIIMIFDDTHGPSLISHFTHYVTRCFVA